MGALLDRWSRAKTEIKLYDTQLTKATETTIFKKIKTGSAPIITDSNSELFRTQTKNIFNAILQKLDIDGKEIESEQDAHKSPTKRSSKSKLELSNDSFEFIQENCTDGLFKKMNQNKSIVRLDGKDFEVNISAHRTPVIDLSSWKEVVVEGKIPSYIQKLSNYLLNLGYEILLVKNNQITIAIDGLQYSVRLTGKTKLF